MGYILVQLKKIKQGKNKTGMKDDQVQVLEDCDSSPATFISFQVCDSKVDISKCFSTGIPHIVGNVPINEGALPHPCLAT